MSTAGPAEPTSAMPKTKTKRAPPVFNFETTIEKLATSMVQGFFVGSFVGLAQSVRSMAGQSLENPSVLNEVVANRSFLMGSYFSVGFFIHLSTASILRAARGVDDVVNHITGGAIAGAVVSFYDYTMPEFSEFHDVDVTSTNPMNSTEQKGLPLTRISSPFSHAGAPGLSILRGILRTSLICGAGGAALFYHRKIVEAQQDWDPDRSVISNILFKEKGSDRNS